MRVNVAFLVDAVEGARDDAVSGRWRAARQVVDVVVVAEAHGALHCADLRPLRW